MTKDTVFVRFVGRLGEDMTFQRTPGWETTRIAHRPEESEGPYELALQDEQGGDILSVRPAVDFHGPCEQNPALPRMARVVAYLPLHPEGRGLQFRRSKRVLFEEKLSAKPPKVDTPRVTVREDRATVQWSASHPEDRPLLYNVVYLVGGRRGFPLARSLQEPHFQFDLSGLPGSRDARIAVLATDGVRSGFAVSEPFESKERPPQAWIQRPLEGEQLAPDQPLNLAGQAVDVAGKRLDNKGLVWLVDGEPVHRDTHSAAFSGLEPGNHKVTLRYQPGRSVLAETMVTVKVAPRSKVQNRYRELLAEIRSRG